MIFHRGQHEPPPLPFDTIPERLWARLATYTRRVTRRRARGAAGKWKDSGKVVKKARKIWIYRNKAVSLHRVSRRAFTE